MIPKVLNITQNGIWFTYLALATVTPLIFSTANSELFEVPKMLFVYTAAVIITSLLLITYVVQKKRSLPLNLILTSFIFLLLTQVASTLISIDKFTSIYGYPSRLNGGLLSQFTYLAILAGVASLSREKILTVLQASVISALAVSLWGIPGHFGYDPNCFVLTGQLTSTCWQKEFDPTLRIFSTLGQPNWLASYLVLIIPISIAQIFVAHKQSARNFFLASTIIILIALIFTNSRAGVAGFIVSSVIFVLILGKQNIAKFKKVIIPLFIISILVGLVFGASLTSRAKETLGQTSTPGTESGAIRLIVWHGAIDVFKNYTLLGTGPETFAYSYYKVRPPEHNQTTEWNFFYNKAHNEFLNYLANTGVLGFSAYLLFLAATLFILWRASQQKDEEVSLISKATFASFVGYQITIFFGFSTVATQVLMLMLISNASVLGKKENLKYISLKFLNKGTQLATILLLVVATSVALAYVVRIYTADVYMAKAKMSGNQGSFDNAIDLFPTTNPFYLADAAFSSAEQIAKSENKSLKASLVEDSKTKAGEAEKYAPNNLLVLRKVANSYFLISQVDESYIQKSLDVGNKLTDLAPNDPQSYLALAKIQSGLNLQDEAKKTLETALKFKPDYVEAQELLDQIEAKELQ